MREGISESWNEGVAFQLFASYTKYRQLLCLPGSGLRAPRQVDLIAMRLFGCFIDSLLLFLA